MPQTIPARHPLRRFFIALTEQTFISTLGVGDPKLTGYLADLLVRFVHVDAIWKLRSAHDKPLAEVAEMMVEADSEGRSAGSTREIHRHIGDFTLFWTGVYPEALGAAHTRSGIAHDRFVDYCQQGKRSYYIASMIPNEKEVHSDVLERLSEEFELCAYGLNEARKEWERRDSGGEGRLFVFN